MIARRVTKKLGNLHRHGRTVIGTAVGLRIVQDDVALRIHVQHGIVRCAAATAATAATCEDFLEADFAFVISNAAGMVL